MRYVLAFVLTACSFPRASSDFTCSVNADCEGGRICEQGFCVVGSEVDAPMVQPDGPLFTCTDWAPVPRHFDPCAIPLPANDGLALDMAGEYTYDTATGILTDPALATSTPANTTIATGRLISVASLSIGTGVTLRVVGDVPLIVASWTTMDIMGAIDAGSTALVAGAGNNPIECAAHAPTRGGNSGNGAGGSGGGSFRGSGGNGGDGDGGGNGEGGAPVAVVPPLLGGCPGAAGGVGETLEGAGGAGGGAIQLTARESITIAGSVNAGGQGGGGAAGNGGGGGSGGGGGGSGGMIGIESPTVTVVANAFVTANGGGGGQGGANQNGNPGQDGIAAIGRPQGGIVANGGVGFGGQGSGNGVLAGGTGQGDNDDGGGGGGGGAGFIAILGTTVTTTGATISPVHVTPP